MGVGGEKRESNWAVLKQESVQVSFLYLLVLLLLHFVINYLFSIVLAGE